MSKPPLNVAINIFFLCIVNSFATIHATTDIWKNQPKKCVPFQHTVAILVYYFFPFLNKNMNQLKKWMNALCEQGGMQCTSGSESWSSIKITCQVLGDDWISHCTESKLMSTGRDVYRALVRCACAKYTNLYWCFVFQTIDYEIIAFHCIQFNGKIQTNAVKTCKLTKYKWPFIMRTQSANEKT